MKKNLYFRTVLRRKNGFKETIYDLAFTVASAPRLLLELFIKQSFGERYFSFSTSVIWTVLLLIVPIPLVSLYQRGSAVLMNEYSSWASVFFTHFLTWYAYAIAFFIFALKRRKEIKRLPSVFDFKRFSLFNGMPTKEFLKLLNRWVPQRDKRIQEILLEPLPFFVGGFVLWIFTQPIGLVILVAAIFYSLSYSAAYHRGDNFVMDKIDEMILNEEMEDAFINDSSAENARGVRFYMRKPTSEAMRRKVADAFVEEDEDVSVAF